MHEVRDLKGVPLDDQQRQHIVDPAKIAAGGAAAPLGALLTSRFGVAGTMLGLALSAVVVTTISDILKAYLQRAPGTVKNIPVSFGTGFSWKNFRRWVTGPFSWFLSLGPSRRRAMLISSIVAGGIAFLIGTSAVTALEVGEGKNLSCWVWSECSTTDSSSGEEASNTSTLPSVLGGSQDLVSSNTPQEGQQQQQGQPSGTPTAKTPDSSQSGQQQIPSGAPQEQQQSPPSRVVETPGSSQPGQQQQTPSGVPQEQQQSLPPTRVVEEQQQSSSGATGEQQSTSSRITEEQQQSPSSIPDSGVGSPQDNSNIPQK